MPSRHETVICVYHYDPLDQITSVSPKTTTESQRFYCKSRIATEIEGLMSRSIFQHDDQLLSQQTKQGSVVTSVLLGTDQQRSVLSAVRTSKPEVVAYSPYGHHAVSSGLLSLLAFNGQHRDPVTGCYMLGNGYRAFNPVLMRFNSPDSWSPFGEGGLNSYAYCLGDPINQSDPLGHAPPLLFKNVALKYLKKGIASSVKKTITKAETKQNTPDVSKIASKKNEAIAEMLNESLLLQKTLESTGEIPRQTILNKTQASAKFELLNNSSIPLDSNGIPKPKSAVTATTPSGQEYLRTDFFDDAISYFHHKATGPGSDHFRDVMAQSVGIAIVRRAKYIRKHALRNK